MRSNKGMALETTAYLIIGLVSLMLLLLLFSGHIKGAMINAYCNIYDTLLTRIPFADVSPPSYCNINPSTIKTNYIYHEDKERVVAYLTSEIVKCYMKMSSKPLSENTICSELVLKGKIPGTITEKDITLYLYKNNLCGLIGNNDIALNINEEEVRCGEGNHVVFEKDISNKDNHAFIIYNYEKDQVIIK